MSPELFDRLDDLMYSSAQYMEDGASEKFDKLGHLLYEFLSGYLEEEPTVDEERLLEPIYHNFINRTSVIMDFARSPLPDDFDRGMKPTSETELKEMMVKAILDSRPDWKEVRSQQTIRLQENRAVPKVHWESFQSAPSFANFIKSKTDGRSAPNRSTIHRWAESEKKVWIKREGKKKLMVDLNHPDAKFTLQL